MVRKLIILGIDGMDRDVLIRYKDFLPNLYGLLQKNNYPKLRSVFPADTTPAWSTIYTGKDPSEHGIINFINVGAQNNTYKPLVFDDSAFKGKAFWDILNHNGFSCSVILPMNIKLGYKIDGLMITRPFKGKIHVYPENRAAIYNPNSKILGTEGKFTSEKDLDNLRDEFFEKVEEEIRLTRLALENEDTDVLFSYFSTTDGIQHDFWRHCDPVHPKYPGPNKHENVIRDMYVRMDEFVGEVIEKSPDIPLLIISDHGHGARPVYTVRINELLKRGGYLFSKVKYGSNNGGGKIKKALRTQLISYVKKIGLPTWTMKLAKKFPIWKSLFASGKDFDWDKTVAYLSDLSALKNYSYGGIRLNSNVEDKDKLSNEIISYLSSVRIENENKPLFEWIVRSNTFYHGKYLSKYPEIIYQMDERYGGEWELGPNIFDKEGGMMYIMSPGGHRWRTAIILGNNLDLQKKNYEMTDIYNIILSAMKIKM